MTKQILRKQSSLVRKDIDNRAVKDAVITDKLCRFIEAIPCEGVFVYVAMGSEADTHEFIRRSFGKLKIGVPYTINGTMVCRELLNAEQLTADKLGNIAQDFLGEQFAPDIVIVPMLAFDTNCYRLGYGGGYYDRYLGNSTAMRVGIAYDEQERELELELFDVPLDVIITPTRLIRRG